MANYIKISTPSIKSETDEMKELIETIPNLIKELETSMGELSSCWEGQSWDEYLETERYYIEILTEVYQYMCKFVTFVYESSQDYNRTEQDVYSKIKYMFI